MPDFKPGCRAEVKLAYQAVYAQPIQMRAGDSLVPGREDTQYPGWIWCSHPSGRSGWTPLAYISIHGATATALTDYDASELTAAAGEVLTLLSLLNGWYWAEKTDGSAGWIPAEHVTLKS
ncbi:MAG: hypothetical protein LWX83_05285 [Anaerolineae bacterium]|nr:hypothetical protein [Anaerolineae bacterium]